MKRKINKLDIAVIVFVIILVGLFAFKRTTDDYDQYKGDSNLPQMESRSFTYRIEEVRQYSFDAVHIGDKFYDDDSGAFIGEVVDVWQEPYKEGILKDDGSYVTKAVPEKLVVYLTIEGPVLETDNKYLAGGSFELKMNSKIMLASNRVIFECVLAYFNE